MEQHQRNYQDMYRGGRRDRQERDSEGRWTTSDGGRSRWQHESRADARHDGGQGRFEPHRVSDDDRGAQSGSRSREWTLEGRGGYGSESGSYEPERPRFQSGGPSSGRSSSYGEYGGGEFGFSGQRDAGDFGDERGYSAGQYGDSRLRGDQQGQQYGGQHAGGSHASGGSSAPWQSSREGRGGQAGNGWSQRASQQHGWQGNAPQDWQGRGFGGGDSADYGMGGSYGGGAQSGRPASARSGGFAGRGPKDYQRSDERIREQISDRMSDDDDLDASEISVQVQKGEVTLTGTVQSREQKRRAEDLAEQCSGVSDVVNNIRVSRERSGSTAGSQPSSQSGSSQSATQAGPKATGKSGGTGANT